jgi:hypothetical protein
MPHKYQRTTPHRDRYHPTPCCPAPISELFNKQVQALADDLKLTKEDFDEAFQATCFAETYPEHLTISQK